MVLLCFGALEGTIGKPRALKDRASPFRLHMKPYGEVMKFGKLSQPNSKKLKRSMPLTMRLNCSADVCLAPVVGVAIGIASESFAWASLCANDKPFLIHER